MAATGLVALTAVGFVMRWVSIDTRGLWLDESITVYQASQSIAGVIESLAGGVHPPLYHILIHFWMVAFGSSEVALRSFSVLVGVLAIPAAYWAGRRLYDRSTGLVAAGLVALSPCLIWYSQEARMYALLFLAGLMSTAFLALALRENRFRLWVGFLLSTLVGMFTHYFFTFLLVGQVLFYLFGVLVPGYRRRRNAGIAHARWWRPWGIFADVPTLPGWLSTHLVAGGAVVWWLMNSVFRPSEGQNALIGSVTGSGLGYGLAAAKLALRFNDIAAVIVQLVAGFHSQATMDVLVSLWPLTLTAMFLLLHVMRPATSRTWLLLVSSGGIFVLLLLGQWQRQVLVSRYFAAVIAPAILLLALLLSKLERKAAVVTMAMLVALWGAAYVDQSYNPENLMRYDNREAFAQIAQGRRPGDAVLYEPDYLFFLASYYLPADIPSFGVPLHDASGAVRNAPDQIANDMGVIVGTSQRVWLFLSFQDIPAVHADGNAVQGWLRDNGFRLAHDDYLNKVEVRRYDALPSLPASASTGATATAIPPAGRGAKHATGTGVAR